MTSVQHTTDNWKLRNKRNTLRLGLWTAGWLVTLALATFGPKLLWNFNTAFSIPAIILNLLVGVGMIWANIVQLKGLDEMQQKIQLNAMGITLGVTLVAGISYSLLDITKVIQFDAEISFLVMLMGLTYLIAILIGNRSYQ